MEQVLTTHLDILCISVGVGLALGFFALVIHYCLSAIFRVLKLTF